jgi:NAD(P)-dependent dehydrogenase (short-subunit alcohol dehydrogenase family)
MSYFPLRVFSRRTIVNWSEKSYLVVGGTSGIGAQIVADLHEKKAAVQVWSRNRPDGGGLAGVDYVTLDVSAPLEDLTLPQQLNGIVYCPGSITLAAVNRLTDQQYLDDYTVNVLGAVRTVRAALPMLMKSDGGAIVLFSTVAARVGMPYHTSIAAAKAAVEGYARSLAAELAPKNVRVNTVAPSITDTPLAASLLSGERRERSAKRHPLARVGLAEDMARAALYLLSDDSSWMTGQTLSIDGGMSSLRLL